MSKQPGPSVRRRQLGAMLRQLRQDSGFTIKEAAEWLDMGEPAVSKIEKASVAIKATIIRALCQLYDVDATKLDYLLRLAKESNERGWWTAYRDTVPDWFRQYVGLESDALDIWNYETEYVPGLLQTPDYVRALMRANRPDMSKDDVERQVELRRERQERIGGGQPPKLHFYLSETVIRRLVGDTHVMGQQLQHLIDSSKLAYVDLRVVPFSAGLHPGMTGAFVMMQFPGDSGPAFVYLEHERGAIYQEDPGDIDRYTMIVAELEKLSLSPEDSYEMLSKAASPRM